MDRKTRIDPTRFERFCARHRLGRRELLLVTLFARAHPEQTLAQALLAFARGEGPAAVAAGRARRQGQPQWRDAEPLAVASIDRCAGRHLLHVAARPRPRL